MKAHSREEFIRKIFDAGIVLKGIDGILEIVGGTALFFIKPHQINTLTRLLTQHELSEDPHDFIATHLVQFVQHVTVKSELFGALYLLSHGAMKIILVLGILKNKLWAYKVGIPFLLLSISYQAFRYFLSYSTGMLLLTLFDIVILWLAWHEYAVVRKEGPN